MLFSSSSTLHSVRWLGDHFCTNEFFPLLSRNDIRSDFFDAPKDELRVASKSLQTLPIWADYWD